MKVVLLWLAKEDLKEIRKYIAKNNPNASKKVAERIKKSLKLLSEQSYIGHIGYDDEVLEWHIPWLPYTLPYRISDNELQILRVFHESQNKPSKWEKQENLELDRKIKIWIAQADAGFGKEVNEEFMENLFLSVKQRLSDNKNK